ncbi:MAG: GNAT family N-acetyltransferase, partial [Candidatus Micrarchaeota archaeon]|nr:GNAT family N-acetyltransferase [Candidatus Micrarchaeota archaeon]
EKAKFIVRPVSRRDRDDLVGCYYSYWEERKQNPLLGLGFLAKKPTLKEEREWFKSMCDSVRRGDTIASVAEVGGKVVGLCDVKGQHRLADTTHVGVLGIAIRKEFRAMGVGSALLKDVIRRSKRRFDIITLSVFGTNKKAEELYRKVGFRRYGVLRGGLRRNGEHIDHIYMYLRL